MTNNIIEQEDIELILILVRCQDTMETQLPSNLRNKHPLTSIQQHTISHSSTYWNTVINQHILACDTPLVLVPIDTGTKHSLTQTFIHFHTNQKPPYTNKQKISKHPQSSSTRTHYTKL